MKIKPKKMNKTLPHRLLLKANLETIHSYLKTMKICLQEITQSAGTTLNETNVTSSNPSLLCGHIKKNNENTTTKTQHTFMRSMHPRQCRVDH